MGTRTNISVPPKPGPDGRALQRALHAELRRLLRRTKGRPRPAQIHDLRRGITRLRAWLRLTSGKLRGREQEKHDRRLRRSAQGLAPMRDAHVARATLKSIHGPAATLAAARQLLRRAERRANRNAAAVMRQTRRRLKREFDAWQSRSLKKLTSEAIHQALEAIRRDMADALTRARATGGLEDLHTWRKRTKKYLHALFFVGGPRQREFRVAVRISRLIGQDRDLALLARALEKMPKSPDQNALLGRIAKQRRTRQARFFADARVRLKSRTRVRGYNRSTAP